MADAHEAEKRAAAAYAVRFLTPGMIVGLGHGSTAEQAIRAVGDLVREGRVHDIRCIPCSEKAAALARELGIPLTTLNEHPVINLTLDGADEVTPGLAIIKGHGGAMLREKIVAQATRREIILIDESKLVPVLGMRAAVPVEVTPFGWRSQASYLERLGARWTLRQDPVTGEPFRTDEHNYVLDCAFGPLDAPGALARQLESRAGIVAHGLFLGLTHTVIVAGPQGVRELPSET